MTAHQSWPKDAPPVMGPAALPIHDIVANDALACGYRALAALVAERGRLYEQHHGKPLHVLTDDEPMVAATIHLADALARLHQAAREYGPRSRARQYYEAALMVAGNIARDAPLGTFRRPAAQRGRGAA